MQRPVQRPAAAGPVRRGAVAVGRGSIEWQGKNRKSKKKRFSWSRFAQHMERLY
jgi:hypothetical protein